MHTYKGIFLINFSCYVHQHGRHGLCHLSPTGLKDTLVKIIYNFILLQIEPAVIEKKATVTEKKSSKCRFFFVCVINC